MDLQLLYLKETQIEKVEKAKRIFSQTFWKRQFQSELTRKQKFFDWMFGILMPVGCIMFDPIVFKGFRMALMGAVKPFAYSLSFVSVMALIAFKLWGEKLKWFNGFLCGLFAIAGIISLLIGIVLLPLSLIGIFVIIGLLGFTPLFTSFVYLRTAVRAFQKTKPFVETKLLFNSIALSAIFSITLPLTLNLKIEKELRMMQYGNSQQVRVSANRLKYIAPLANFDKLAEISCDENDLEKNRAIFESFQQLTGESIERKNYIICNDF